MTISLFIFKEDYHDEFEEELYLRKGNVYPAEINYDEYEGEEEIYFYDAEKTCGLYIYRDELNEIAYELSTSINDLPFEVEDDREEEDNSEDWLCLLDLYMDAESGGERRFTRGNWYKRSNMGGKLALFNDKDSTHYIYSVYSEDPDAQWAPRFISRNEFNKLLKLITEPQPTDSWTEVLSEIFKDYESRIYPTYTPFYFYTGSAGLAVIEALLEGHEVWGNPKPKRRKRSNNITINTTIKL